MTFAKRSFAKLAGMLLGVGLLSAALVAQTPAAARYDNRIQDCRSATEARREEPVQRRKGERGGWNRYPHRNGRSDDLYQRKLDAAKLARKTANTQGVRNLVTVAGPNVPDEQLNELAAELAICASVMTTRSTTSLSR